MNRGIDYVCQIDKLRARSADSLFLKKMGGNEKTEERRPNRDESLWTQTLYHVNQMQQNINLPRLALDLFGAYT